MRTLVTNTAAFVLLLALDLLAKALAETNLVFTDPVPVLGSFFRLTLGYNTGVAFGLFANGGPWPLVVTGLIIAGMIVWASRVWQPGELPGWAGVPFGLILAGAAGNFIDRLPDGRVTDYLDVGLGPNRWPTFNLADTFIVIGVAILLLTTLIRRPSEEVRG